MCSEKRSQLPQPKFTHWKIDMLAPSPNHLLSRGFPVRTCFITFMRRALFACACGIVLFTSALVYAVPIHYTMNGIGTGSFSGQAFNGAFTIDLSGDTTSVTQPSPGVFFSGGTATVNIAGIGSGTFTDQIVAVSNQTGVGGISDLTIGLALDLIDAPGFSSYDLKSALGGITSVSSQLSPDLFPTDHGNFQLTAQSQGTFSAVVPEPSSMMLAMLGLLGVVVCVRRGQRQHKRQFVRTSFMTLVAAVMLSAAVASPSLAITYTTLDFPGGTSTEAHGIDGSNIVGSYTDATTKPHGFLYNGSTYTTLDDPLGTQGTIAYGISGSKVVGTYYDATGNGQGFLYDGSSYTTIDDPLAVGVENDAIGISGNTIVGLYGHAGSGFFGFLYNGTTYTTLTAPLAAGDTDALGITGNNIVGQYTDAGGVAHGFLYQGSTYTTLNDPLATAYPQTTASGISGGNIVGFYTDSSTSHGFLYSGGTYTNLDYPLATSTTASGISGNRIVGYYTDSSDLEHGFVASVPEPSTVATLIAGMLLMCGCRRSSVS